MRPSALDSSSVDQLAELLTTLRIKRGISLRQLADEARVSPAAAHRAERGADARMSTWSKLFAGLGYDLQVKVTERCEEAEDLLREEAARRRERRRQGLCTGKRRF